MRRDLLEDTHAHVDLPLLELLDHLHVLLLEWDVLKVAELAGVVREVEHVDGSLMLLVELLDEGLSVLVESESGRCTWIAGTVQLLSLRWSSLRYIFSPFSCLSIAPARADRSSSCSPALSSGSARCG